MPENLLNETDHRSDEVSEIIGQAPSWMVRRGTGTFFILIGLLLAGSWFFRYPDVLTTTVTITTENPPLPAVARADGKITSLFVGDTQRVAEGEVLAIIENPANAEHVLQLHEYILSYGPAAYSGDAAGFMLKWQGRQLGEVQESFARHQKAYMEYRNFNGIDYHRKKIRSLEKELMHHRNHYSQVLRQSRILEREYELCMRQFARDSVLYAEKLIAEAAWEQSEASLLRKAHELEQSLISLSSTSVLMAEKEREILELELDREISTNHLFSECLESFEMLRSAIALWEQSYVLRAPAGGTVSFTRFWSRDQYVEAGETVMTVIPADQGMLIGRTSLAQRRAGKVKTGHRVLIRFANYPYLEYGMSEGVVRSISKVTEKDNYVVEISLPRLLQTNYGISLEFIQGMQGTAEIITDERPLLMRIFEPFRYIYERHLRN